MVEVMVENTKNGTSHRVTGGSAKPEGAKPNVFEMMAFEMREYMKGAVDLDAVQRIVDAAFEKATLPRVVEFRSEGKTLGKTSTVPHTQFDELVKIHGEGANNIMMVGPAGSGKTTLAHSLAEALGCEFGFISLSAGITETHLFGRMLPQADGSWKYIPSKFVEIYENGGVFLLDEVDAADSNVMVSINAALANGVMANPNGLTHKRHKDTIIIAAANTYGRGGDFQYVGRNQLDAATLDRFVLSTMFVDYDVTLEERILRAEVPDNYTEVSEFISDLRGKVASYKVRRVVSTRLVVGIAKVIKAGGTLSEAKARFFKSWSVDERSKVMA